MLFRLAIVLLGAVSLLPAADPNLLKAAKAKVEAGQFDAAVALLEPAFNARKHDRELRRALSETYVAYGDHYMHNPQMPVFMKQPNALRYYKLAVAYDQTNREAQRKVESMQAVSKAAEKSRKK
jgi:tetratricopeptide (TPR) repeat protein